MNFKSRKSTKAKKAKNEIQVDKHENLNEDSGIECEHISKLQSAGMIENNADDPQKTKAKENKKDTNEFQIEKINERQESNDEIQVDKHENLNEDSGFQCEHISKLQSAGTIENNADDPQKTKAEENKKDTNEFQIEKSKVEIDTQSQSCNQEETLMNKTEQEEEQSIKKQSKENNFQNESFEDNSSTYTLDEEVTKESENENYDNVEYDGYLCYK